MRIREVGESALVLDVGATYASPLRGAVVDAGINARAVALADTIRARRIAGVRDVVSTFHSVTVFFEPLVADAAALASALREASVAPPTIPSGRLIEVPVTYGGKAGPDLADVAALAGCTPAEVIERHAARTYRVYMLGFLPGYPYMAIVDEQIAVPRRATPRVRVPAGSVAIAGRQTGIYPRESPGGWQIIGRTNLTLFDAEAEPPALFAPGDEVRFVPVDADVASGSPDVASGFSRTDVRPKADTTYEGAIRTITVLQPGLLTTIQDEGRWGYQGLGVPVAGPMDPVAHRLANALVGNPREAATLEATLIGPELRFDQDTWIVVTGGDLQPALDGRDAPMYAPLHCRAGSVLRFGSRRSGARAYIAVDGGIAVPPVLGSRATHVLSGLGGIDGRALRAGDRLPMGRPGLKAGPYPRPDFARAIAGADRQLGPQAGPAGGVRLRILPGPQADSFDPTAFDLLQQCRYTISPQSDRMGYRLTGGVRLPAPAGEMISDVVFSGALQVPPSGEPILLMADRQTTGGYPQIALVIAADLPLAAQLAPGDCVEFEVCSRSEAIEALRAQEGQLGALR
ncbi:MAG: 5-oxoprolinase subunit PxpB [Acidobacteria bacterium]|nr:5-oxoprolinase subunit PxpB [Acidobacteriota bacterium]